MPLKSNASAGDYIKDFQKSKAPQFKGKTKEKRRQMAIAAYMSKKDVKEAFKIGDQVEWKTKTMFGPNRRTGKVTQVHPDNHYTVDTNAPWKKAKSFPSKVHGDQLSKQKGVNEEVLVEANKYRVGPQTTIKAMGKVFKTRSHAAQQIGAQMAHNVQDDSRERKGSKESRLRDTLQAAKAVVHQNVPMSDAEVITTAHMNGEKIPKKLMRSAHYLKKSDQAHSDLYASHQNMQAKAIRRVKKIIDKHYPNVAEDVANRQVVDFFTEAFNTDYHLQKMNDAFKNYNKAVKMKNQDLTKIHAKEYHLHKSALDRLAEFGDYKKS